MVRVRLRTDQGPIHPQINLFDDGVGQIVGGPEFISQGYVVPIAFFQLQIHGEVTAIQIHMIGQGWDDEFHGVDARGGGLDGHHAIGFDADVCGRHLEDPQPRVDDPGGLGMRSLGHGERVQKKVFFQRRRRRLFRLDEAGRRAAGFLYHPPPPRWGRRRRRLDNCWIN